MLDHDTSPNRTRHLWFILTGLVVFIMLISGCNAQTSPKTYRVGVLSGLDFFSDTVDGFKAKMTELGYVEGKNISYDLQKTNFEPVKEKQILDKFVADKVDLIFTFPTEVALAAKTATQGTNIPVLFASSFTEGTDLIKSVREPGGNITGVRYPGPDLAVKGLETLHEIAPQAKRIWVPYLRGYPSIPGQLAAMRPVAASLGVTLVEVPVTNTAEVEADLQTRDRSDDLGIDAILTIYEPVATWADAVAVITKFAAKHQMPIGNQVIFRIVVDNVQVGRQAAPLADKILKGIPAGTIPVVSADPILVINYKEAQDLGMTVPESLLGRANKVIK